MNQAIKALVENFPRQLEEALAIKPGSLTLEHKPIQNVVIAGMGGSAIGATLVIDCVRDIVKIPISVSRDYTLPGWVNSHTLLIISSYSGDTEETIHAFEQGIQREAKIVCITSGGSLEHLGRQAAFDVVNIPAGMPPRAAIAYSFVVQLSVLHYFGVIDNGYENGVNQAISLLHKNIDRIKKTAAGIAKKCVKKMAVIYIQQAYESVAIRWRQQLNENAKTLAMHNVLPEMNHNEIMGWTGKQKYCVILIRTIDENDRMKKRFDFLERVIGETNKTVITVDAKGKSRVEQALYLVHLADWVSVYLADGRGVDAMDIGIIENLKKALD